MNEKTLDSIGADFIEVGVGSLWAMRGGGAAGKDMV